MPDAGAAQQKDDATPLTRGIRDTYVGALRLARSCHLEDLLDGAEYAQAKQEAQMRYNDAMKERQEIKFKDSAVQRKRTVEGSCDDSSAASEEEQPKNTSRSNQTKTSRRPRNRSRSGGGSPSSTKRIRTVRTKSLTPKDILEGHKRTIDEESSTPVWYCDPAKEEPEMSQVKSFGNRICASKTVGDEELVLWTIRTDDESAQMIAECSICKADPDVPYKYLKTYMLEVCC